MVTGKTGGVTGKTEDENETNFNILKKELRFNKDELIHILLSNINTAYLRNPNPQVTDWGRTIPRYHTLFVTIFTDGHPLFTMLNTKLLEIHNIELTDRDIVHFVLNGIFWRYGNKENGAITEFKTHFQNSEYYKRVTHMTDTKTLIYKYVARVANVYRLY